MSLLVYFVTGCFQIISSLRACLVCVIGLHFVSKLQPNYTQLFGPSKFFWGSLRCSAAHCFGLRVRRKESRAGMGFLQMLLQLRRLTPSHFCFCISNVSITPLLSRSLSISLSPSLSLSLSQPAEAAAASSTQIGLRSSPRLTGYFPPFSNLSLCALELFPKLACIAVSHGQKGL